MWFALPPLIHAAAMMPTFTALFSGNTVLLESKFDADRTWELVERHKVQILIITGDAMGRPLIEAHQPSRTDTSSLGVVASGAALFSPVIKDAFLDAFPGLLVSDSIGASETGFGGIGFATKGEKQVGGPRVPAGRYALVIDENDVPVEPGSGKDGWFAKGGYVPVGYYNDPEKTREIFREVDGRPVVVTGDRARIEADGSITLLGRGNMVINTGGEKVFAEEVESAVKAYHDVYDAIVVGVPDERWGAPGLRGGAGARRAGGRRLRRTRGTRAAEPGRLQDSAPGVGGRHRPAHPRAANPTTAGPRRHHTARPRPPHVSGEARSRTLRHSRVGQAGARTTRTVPGNSAASS